jgi:hypothetical protein
LHELLSVIHFFFHKPIAKHSVPFPNALQLVEEINHSALTQTEKKRCLTTNGNICMRLSFQQKVNQQVNDKIRQQVNQNSIITAQEMHPHTQTHVQQ